MRGPTVGRGGGQRSARSYPSSGSGRGSHVPSGTGSRGTRADSTRSDASGHDEELAQGHELRGSGRRPETFRDETKVSKLKFWKRQRSEELSAIEAALDRYNDEDDRPDVSMANKLLSLDKIVEAIDTWISLGETDHRVQVQKLRERVLEEKAQLQREKKERVSACVPRGTYDQGDDPATRARKIFPSFMSWVHGAGIKYATKGRGEILAGAKVANCGMFARGLADVLKDNGVHDAVSGAYGKTNFVTAPVDGDFADPSAVGNLTTSEEARDFDSVKRFFFTVHSVTRAAGQMFDPTAGKAGDPGVMVEGLAKTSDKPLTYEGSGKAVTELDGESPSGNGYRLTSKSETPKTRPFRSRRRRAPASRARARRPRAPAPRAREPGPSRRPSPSDKSSCDRSATDARGALAVRRRQLRPKSYLPTGFLTS